MNSSKEFFTAEELTSVTPWRLPSVDEEWQRPRSSSAGTSEVVSEEELEKLPRLTAQEIEAMQRQAYEEASEQGRQEGLEQGREQGYKEGFEQGQQEGYSQGENDVKAQIAMLGQIVSALDHPLAQMDEQVEEELAALAIALARQLVRRELKTDPGQIIAVVREALSVLPANSRKVNLYLHPEDAELVRSALSIDEHGQRWKLVDDPLLSRGGCRITSENSAIDATVEKRMAAAIARALGGERGGDAT